MAWGILFSSVGWSCYVLGWGYGISPARMKMKKILINYFFLFIPLFSIFASEQKARENEVVRAFRKAGPAVVSIKAIRVEISRTNWFGFPREKFWSDFFDNFFFGPEIRREQENIGSGVIIAPNGYILTNQHVIEGAEKILVVLLSGEQYQAKVIGADTRSDLAVLKIDPKKPLPYLPMGTSSDLMIGETLIAIGNPFGLGPTLTVGVASALHRRIKIDNRVYGEFIQTDASINPGNSGGALLNILGELVGITTAIYANAQGIGFAIPIDKAKRIVDDLVKYGEVHPGWLGLELQPLTEKMRSALSLPSNNGILIVKVWENSPADKAGLKPGMVILEIDHQAVSSLWDYKFLLSEITVGDRVKIKYFDQGKIKETELISQEYPWDLAPQLCWKLLGIEVKSTPRGVMISRVDPDSPAGQAGIGRGDIIIRFNQKDIFSLDDFYNQLIKNRNQQSVLVVIKRGNFYYYVTLLLRS